MQFSKDPVLNSKSQSFIEAYRKISSSVIASLDAYNQQYISKYIKDIEYNTLLAAQLIEGVSTNQNIIDLGGGIGFNSAFFSYLGFKNVTYIDIDPESEKAATSINKSLNFNSIQYLNGGYDLLNSMDLSNTIVTSRDVIEHVFDLKDFFKTTIKAEENRHNTAAIANSILRGSEFKKIHKQAESISQDPSIKKSRDSSRSYFEMRLHYIESNYPEIEEKERLAANTRGLRYQEIRNYIDNGTLPEFHQELLMTNTCDPKTGNWAERILTQKQYVLVASKVGIIPKFSLLPYNTQKGSAFNKAIKAVLNQAVTIFKLMRLAPSFTIRY